MVRRIERWIYAIGVTAIGVTAAVVIGCAGSDADDDDDEAICEEDVDDSDCEVCIKTGCCDSYSACQNNADCACVLACSTENQTEAQCIARCKVTDAELDEVLTLLNGDNQACSVQCQDQCAVYAFDDDDDGF